MTPLLRPETSADADTIDALTRAAFRDHPHSRRTEHLIVHGLRAAGALALSLVAEVQGRPVAHLALSPVHIGGRPSTWWGLGPVSVEPAWQRRGLGSALVAEALRRMHEAGVGGCVVLGDPAYYGRFGFAPRPGLVYPGPPPELFMARVLAGPAPAGEVAYHPAFDVDP